MPKDTEFQLGHAGFHSFKDEGKTSNIPGGTSLFQGPVKNIRLAHIPQWVIDDAVDRLKEKLVVEREWIGSDDFEELIEPYLRWALSAKFEE